jgi:pimeloyl-ACP methyl ester carboxylesterase
MSFAWTRSALSRVLAYILLCLTITGCISHRQYRTDYSVCEISTSNACDSHALQRYDRYLLGFIEFDDQGQLWDRAQAASVIDAITREAAEKEVLIVVFVHGWKHSAAPDDDNIKTFCRALASLSEADARTQRDAGASPRQVIGVYLGWRGGSVSAPLIKELSFWERKNTAAKVGHGSVTEVLTRLEQIKRTKNALEEDGESKLVVVGHSLGGAVVYAAVGQILENRFVHTEGPTGLLSNIPGFGDLVVLINPAFEANRFATLSDLSFERGTYFESQLPVLAVLTSEADDATKRAFPIGRWFSTLFEKTHDMKRRNAVTGEVETIDGNKANLTAIGHFPPYRTHTLAPVQAGRAAQPQAMEPAQVASYSLEAGTQWADDKPGSVIRFGDVELERGLNSAGRNPFLVIYVDGDLIRDHNDIDDPRIISFIEQLILISAQSRPQLKQTLDRAKEKRGQ